MRTLKYGSVELILGDIVEQTTDAIVNAANTKLADAASIAIDSVCSFLHTNPGLELVRFVLFKQGQFDIFQSALDDWSPK